MYSVFYTTGAARQLHRLPHDVRPRIESTVEEKIRVFYEYLALCKKYRLYDFNRIRDYSLSMIKGFTGAARMREQLSTVKKEEEIVSLLEKILLK